MNQEGNKHKSNSARFGLNEFSDMTEEERKILLGYRDLSDEEI